MIPNPNQKKPLIINVALKGASYDEITGRVIPETANLMFRTTCATTELRLEQYKAGLLDLEEAIPSLAASVNVWLSTWRVYQVIAVDFWK
jgi:hypothetical protein